MKLFLTGLFTLIMICDIADTSEKPKAFLGFLVIVSLVSMAVGILIMIWS